MTPVTASSHHAPVGEAHFRHPITVVPTPAKTRATSPIIPKSPRQPPPPRQNPDPDRRSNDHHLDNRSPHASRSPGKYP